MTTMHIAIITVGGFFGALINAAGAGGGLLSFLALTVCGVPAQTANATNLLVMPLSFLPGFTTLKHNPVDRSFRTSAMTGTAAGVALAHILHPEQFNAAVPWLVYAATALLLIEPIARSRRTGDHLTSLVRERPKWVTASLLLVTSVYAGFFGGGVGTLVLVVLSSTTSWQGDLTGPNRTKIAICLITSLVGTAGFAVAAALTGGTLINLAAAIVLAPSMILGGILGARLATRISTGTLRGGVAVLSGGGATWLLLAGYRS